jgi:hypothetical protein
VSACVCRKCGSCGARLTAIYAKSGGKAAKHSWVSDSSNIAAVSNIPVQLFDHVLGVQFCAIPGGKTLHVKRFCLLLPLPSCVPLKLLLPGLKAD